MSGGALDYLPYRVKSDIFGYSCETSHQARQLDPLKNPEISELVFDVCELLHEAEWYLSGDTSIVDYDEAINSFKTKWLNSSGEERADDDQKKSNEDINVAYIKSNTEEIKALINAFDKSTKDIQGLSRLSVLDKMDVLGILAKHMKKVVDEYPVIKDLM